MSTRSMELTCLTAINVITSLKTAMHVMMRVLTVLNAEMDISKQKKVHAPQILVEKEMN